MQPEMNAAPRPTYRRRLACVLAVASLGVLAGCGAGQRNPEHKEPQAAVAPTGTTQRIGSENLAYLWPLTVDSGDIQCRAGEQAVFVAPDGRSYALNRKAEDAGVPSIEPIRADGSGGGKVSLGALLSRTMDLCGRG